VYDFDRDGELVFLVMELLEGISLERLIKDSSRRGLPPTETLRILRGLGSALAHAHQKGVVHCDFKPANAFRCGDGSIKVFDFGIARAIVHGNMRPNETRFDAGTLGALTPGYASCELELGAEPDPRDDVFALACVAYELFSGKHPYDRTSALQAERSGMKLEPIEGLDRRTWRGLQRGLAFARNDRTPTIEKLIAELAPRRHVEVAVVAAAVAAGVAAFSIGVWLNASPDRPKQTAASEAAQPTDPGPTAKPIAQTASPVDAGSERRRPSSVPAKPPMAETTASVPVSSAPPAGTDQATNAKKEEGLQAASAEVLKKQLIAAARSNSVSNALDAFRDLEARLPASDPFLVDEAPVLIGQAYQRLAAQRFASGNFDAASSLLDRALERLPNDPALQASKQQAMRVTALARMLETENNLSAETIQQRLTEIRDAGDPESFAVVNTRLADTFASRIKKELETDPEVGAANLTTALAVFAGVASIDAIKSSQLAAQ